MDNGSLGMFSSFRGVFRKPTQQVVHGRDLVSLRSFILLSPSLDLPLKIVRSDFAKLTQSDCSRIQLLESSQDVDELFVSLSTF